MTHNIVSTDTYMCVHVHVHEHACIIKILVNYMFVTLSCSYRHRAMLGVNHTLTIGCSVLCTFTFDTSCVVLLHVESALFLWRKEKLLLCTRHVLLCGSSSKSLFTIHSFIIRCLCCVCMYMYVCPLVY